jgi:16S rRNA U516 pseudouridylate synthase RsuA-like enzyme
VRRLHRSGYGPLTLDGLEPGEWRELTAAEVEALRR